MNARSSKRQSKWVLAAFTIFAVSFGCQSGSTGAIDDLVGVWKTPAPRYADRFFEFTKDYIIFGTGEGGTTAHTIKTVKEVREGKKILYTVYYENRGGQESTFSFYFDPDSGGVIAFKNQQEIAWARSSR